MYKVKVRVCYCGRIRVWKTGFKKIRPHVKNDYMGCIINRFRLIGNFIYRFNKGLVSVSALGLVLPLNSLVGLDLCLTIFVVKINIIYCKIVNFRLIRLNLS